MDICMYVVSGSQLDFLTFTLIYVGFSRKHPVSQFIDDVYCPPASSNSNVHTSIYLLYCCHYSILEK